MPCSRCGSAVSDEARFCPSCGQLLAAEAVTMASGTPAPPSNVIADAATRFIASGRRTPPAERAPASSSGWLTSSDSISHGRFTPGTILDSRYRVIGLLGRGGMGEVYRADDLRLGQPVALKFLPDSVGNDPVKLAQFHNEVRTARQVSHPNICRVHDIGEVEGHLYLSMEYVDGEDLSTSLRRIGRFPEDRAIEIARQLCAGLAAAHERGVLHRDLKPANVMLDGSGRVRVMDFGLAAIGAVEDVRAGTPAYMAPEQLLGREVTARSDIFALGLVLYELFTGRRAFTATTLATLVEQHQSAAIEPPSSIVSNMDPAVERAILRCLDPDPARRPSSALAVSAAMPGGDPLAAALAAGETPSPEMVAAAGEGVALRRLVAVPVFLFALAGIVASLVISLRTNPLERMRPAYSTEVLTQKARDAIARIGYADRPRDEEYGFLWDGAFTNYVAENDKPAPRWEKIFGERPSPLLFWYRKSRLPLTGLEFHTDLLTAGIVTRDDPDPIVTGMVEARLDHEGRLTYFEAIPPQRDEKPVAAAPVDWAPIFALAGLDPAQLQPTEPQWNWLASADTRLAWAGTWPGSGRPLRVEAAARGGRPVAFMLTGAWEKPSRMPGTETSEDTIGLIFLIVLLMSILTAAFLLAWKNLRNARGDRRGAFRLASAVAVLLMAVWLFQVHLVASFGLVATFFISLCTSIAYGVLLWILYIALEPFVRRLWPQTLVSWSSLLTGRVSDPVVGRDVLVGAAFGIAAALMFRAADLWFSGEDFSRGFPGADEFLTGVRPTLGFILWTLAGSIRTAFLLFFLLFLLRVFLRNKWVAAFAFAALFFLQEAVGDPNPWVDGTTTFLFFAAAAVAVLRWGFLALPVQLFVTNTLLNLPVSGDLSSWYMANTVLAVVLLVGLISWALYRSLAGRLWTTDLFA